MLKEIILVQRWRGCKCRKNLWKGIDCSAHLSKKDLKSFIRRTSDSLRDSTKEFPAIHFCPIVPVGKPKLISVSNYIRNLVDRDSPGGKGLFLMSKIHYLILKAIK